MLVRKVNLNSIEKVKRFVDIAQHQIFDIDLNRGRYQIDAKSIMGIFSLDLSKDIDLIIYADEDRCSSFLEDIKEFLV